MRSILKNYSETNIRKVQNEKFSRDQFMKNYLKDLKEQLNIFIF